MDRLLVPVDGSECSLHALDFAVALAKAANCEIVLCHIVDLGKAAGMTGGDSLLLEGCYEALEAEGDCILQEATKRAGTGVKIASRKCQGAPITEILRLSGEIKPHFIVIGSHGRSGFKRFLIGSVAEGVARGSSVPVMIVPTEEHERAAATTAPLPRSVAAPKSTVAP
jgi:nucleotide-binding universal stress UspA family protein